MTATPEAQGQVPPLPGDPAYVTARPANPAGLPTAYEHGGRLTPEGSTVDPILVEIVQGTPPASRWRWRRPSGGPAAPR